jgi:nitrogen fixation NifU-like protein
LYTAEIRDHFNNPRNAGEVFDPDASVMFTNLGCGDVLKLTLKVSGDRIDQIRFRAQGCVSVIVCASALTELATGRKLSDARLLRATEISSALGKLTPGTAHGSHLAIKALTAALDQFQRNRC